MPVDHWMMFATFAEQRHFEYPDVGSYSGVIINGNMAAHAPSGLAVFLLERTRGMRYIVDPLTHAFQHDPETIANPEGEPKSSIRSLADHFGPPVSDLVGRRPLLPKHLSDAGVRRAFVEASIRFQLDHLRNHMLEADARKYLGDEAISPPYAIVAPYFYLTESTIGDWLPLCEACAQDARAVVPGPSPKLFASIVLSQGALLESAARQSIVHTFGAMDVDGYLLWIDEFDEQGVGTPHLQALLEVAQGLRGANGREVINTHGGYFSILAAGKLGSQALSGVCHGPEFGEFRGVIPVGGGIPIARFYLPSLHARIRYRDAVRILQEKGWLASASVFHEKVCDCEACREVIADDIGHFTLYGEGSVRSVRRGTGIVRISFPTKEAKLRSLRHYLQRKKREFVASSDAPENALWHNLSDCADELEDVAGLEGVGHLRRWAGVLRQWRDR